MQFVSTDKAPAAIGPYSQAVIAGGFVYTAGQIALDPATMEMVASDVAAQTERVFENLSAVLTAAGCGFSDVVKTTVFLADMADFAAMNEVYARYFGNHRPARAALQAAALPKGGLVEIEAVAHLGGAGP
jgi:2-iminobutanoate/2-iminopropanoate deaminase